MTRIDDLLQAMTLAEKIGQLTMMTAGYAVTGPVVAGNSKEAIRAGRCGSLLNLWGSDAARDMQRLAVEDSRLGIPLILGFDVVHGHRTVFPIPLGEAALFDPPLWEATARAAADEATSDGLSLTFAPMIDVSRDPRWGRIAEGPGEDPWVASRFAEAKIRGFQGTDLSAATSIAATAKHFCAYGAPVAGRDYASVDISERTLREVYLPPFEAAVKAGAAAFMPAFHDLAGIPLHAHVPLLRGWLRDSQGFDGLIISDYNAIAELLAHGIAGTIPEAAAFALKAGVDIDMMGSVYSRGLADALAAGLVELADIDASVRRVLACKERLGLFDDPYRRGSSAPARPEDTAARRALAREVGRRAIVLLTNKDNALPLSSGLRRIAVVGPLADARADMRGSWSGAGRPEDPVTVLEGLRTALPDCRIDHVAGVAIQDADTSGIADAVEACRSAEVVILCIGESSTMSGEASSRAYFDLPGKQRELADAVLELRKPTIVLLSSGRPLAIGWLTNRADAVLATWFLGGEAGNAIADVLTGAFDATGRLPVTWPRDVGQVPIYFAERPSGRPANLDDHYTSKYLDMPVEPLFPFGHGLSYGEVELSNLRADPAEVGPGGTIEIAVDATAPSGRSAEETVFLFVRDIVASVARPLMELKDGAKVRLEPGATSTVRWRLTVASLAFLDANLQLVLEPGEFELLVGPSADRARLLTARINLLAAKPQVLSAAAGNQH